MSHKKLAVFYLKRYIISAAVIALVIMAEINITADDLRLAGKIDNSYDGIMLKSENDTESPVIVNINTASVHQLQRLHGIGEVTARNIVEYREGHGEFRSVDDLINVSGIGEKTLENIRPFITV